MRSLEALTPTQKTLVEARSLRRSDQPAAPERRFGGHQVSISQQTPVTDWLDSTPYSDMSSADLVVELRELGQSPVPFDLEVALRSYGYDVEALQRSFSRQDRIFR